MAVGSKFTGLLAPLMVVTIFFVDLLRDRTGPAAISFMKRILAVALPAILVYVGGWYAHFRLLTLPGEGDAWGLPIGNFLQDLYQIHITMLRANYNLKASHGYASIWWSWPFVVKPVFYWVGEARRVYFVGNVAVWWGAFIGLVLGCQQFIGKLIEAVKTKSPLPAQFWVTALPLTAYLFSFLPFFRIPRSLFLYHYMTPLIFSLIFGVMWFDYVATRTGENVGDKRFSQLQRIGLGCIIATFLALTPMTFGIAAGEWYWSSVFWIFPGWR
jgi:dolichyl-phosphate-mannose-protein mannosyltransferase